MAEALKPLNTLVYGLCAGLWDLAGEGSKAIMRQIGRELYERFIKENMDRSSLEKALESTRKIMAERFKVCEDVSYTLKGDLVEIKVSGCILAEATKMLMEKNIPPIFCPYANIFMTMLEDVTGSSYDIKSIERVSEEESRIILEKVA